MTLTLHAVAPASSGFEVFGNMPWISVRAMVSMTNTKSCQKEHILPIQCGHRVCIFFVCPHAGHLFNAVTSLRAFPASNLCRFFMCEVFFLGTARRTPSQISPNIPGMLWSAAGIAIAIDGHVGYGDCLDCCVYSRVDLKGVAKVVVLSRGRKDETAEAIRSCGTAAAMVMLWFADHSPRIES